MLPCDMSYKLKPQSHFYAVFGKDLNTQYSVMEFSHICFILVMICMLAIKLLDCGLKWMSCVDLPLKVTLT